MNEVAIKALKEARTVVKKGWWNGQEFPRNLALNCAWTALPNGLEADWEPLYTGKVPGAMIALACVINGDYEGNLFEIITKWNDQPERNKEQVLDMFDQAISLAMSNEDI